MNFPEPIDNPFFDEAGKSLRDQFGLISDLACDVVQLPENPELHGTPISSGANGITMPTSDLTPAINTTFDNADIAA